MQQGPILPWAAQTFGSARRPTAIKLTSSRLLRPTLLDSNRSIANKFGNNLQVLYVSTSAAACSCFTLCVVYAPWP